MIALKVNGEVHQLENVDPETPLLWVLRDTLGPLFFWSEAVGTAATRHPWSDTCVGVTSWQKIPASVGRVYAQRAARPRPSSL